MNYTILQADMNKNEEGFVGYVRFQVEGHAEVYEITLHRKDRRDWAYGLHFADNSGNEDNIAAVEEWLEEDDNAFDAFVDAAQNAGKA